jgi:hypothetical protein
VHRGAAERVTRQDLEECRNFTAEGWRSSRKESNALSLILDLNGLQLFRFFTNLAVRNAPTFMRQTLDPAVE